MNINVAEIKVLELCENFRDGVTEKMILEHIPELQRTDIKNIFNRLLGQSKVELHKKRNELMLIYKDPSTAISLSGANISSEEQQIFSTIQESGNQGIWLKDIRAKCNLHMNIITKLVKKLEGQKAIKSFIAISAPTKKRYILFKETPDRALTGGAFYTDQQFDTELVEVLNRECYRFLEKKAAAAKETFEEPLAIQNASCATTEETLKYISSLGFLIVKLTSVELESILETLVYDGKVEKVHTLIGDKVTASYHLCKSLAGTPAISCVPCGMCPLIDSCSDHGPITPAKCVYMKDWLGW